MRFQLSVCLKMPISKSENKHSPSLFFRQFEEVKITKILPSMEKTWHPTSHENIIFLQKILFMELPWRHKNHIKPLEVMIL